MDRFPNEILWDIALYIEAADPMAQVTFGRLRLCHRKFYALFSQFYYSNLTLPPCNGYPICNDACIFRLGRVVQRLHEEPEVAAFVKHLKVAYWAISAYRASSRNLDTVVRFESHLLISIVRETCMYPEEGTEWIRSLEKGHLGAWTALALPVLTGLRSIELDSPSQSLWVFKMIEQLTHGVCPPKYEGALAQLRYASVDLGDHRSIRFSF